MFMTKRTEKQAPTPKQAVVVRKDGTFMTLDDFAGKLYDSGVGLFTIFPSKAAASRAIRTMVEQHDPEFWRLHDVEEYEEL